MSEQTLRRMLEGYSARVLERLPEGTAPGRVVPVAPGITPAADDCCEGLLYGRVVQIVPATEARPSGAGVRCGVLLWAVTLAVGMFRCAATIEQVGRTARMPTAAAVTADGYEMLDDMRVIHDAIMGSEHTRSVIGWNPLEVEGGCHGGEWVFTVRLEPYPELPAAASAPAPDPAP